MKTEISKMMRIGVNGENRAEFIELLNKRNISYDGQCSKNIDEIVDIYSRVCE